MIIKCKMCGGDIQFNPGDTNGQCDHCGCTTTFPKLPDEQRANLFNRANHFRRQCEFDKAMAAYEHILEEDDTDAEAHWGIVLSKFGIEYVEDPVTHERIPTCHRAQVISILSDEDYQNALKYAPDTYSREIYEKEAKRIAEIQKGILAISSQEKPYDVFICYKETDDSGSRTKDSTLAQEIYYQLTNEGYKVFFSRITLEDKLGQEYEPYIFAALNSAKVMLVVGTRPEFFNAVWVKNEWSRFLAIMKNDRKRVLIPCYRDMDPYDLPEELSSLQSQDMGKIGFMQDLIHGIKKVMNIENQINKHNYTAKNEEDTDRKVDDLLEFAVLAIEEKNFPKLDNISDQILARDVHNAKAYLYKLFAEKKVLNFQELASLADMFDTSVYYKYIIKYGDQQLVDEVSKALETINERIHNQEKLKASIEEMITNAKKKREIKKADSLLNHNRDIPEYASIKREIENKKTKLRIKKATKICAVLVLVFLLNRFIVSPHFTRIDGTGMEPFIQNGEIVLIGWEQYFFSNPRCSDIIIYHRSNSRMIGRIIGIPGDTVRVENGSLLINEEKANVIDKKSKDLFQITVKSDKYSMEPYTLLKNQYYVVLDCLNPIEFKNANHASNWVQSGIISKDQIEGPLSYVIFPFSQQRRIQ